jgi:hypothetical protein
LKVIIRLTSIQHQPGKSRNNQNLKIPAWN